MTYINILRPLRPRFVLFPGCTRFPPIRHAAQASVCCLRGSNKPLLQLSAAAERPFSVPVKVWSKCLSSRCLSTTTPPNDGNLIYIGSMGGVVRGVKFFSYSTSLATLCLVPPILLKTALAVQGLAVQVAFCSCMSFFTFLTPILLHFLTKGYVIRLYHNPDSDMYTAVTYNAFMFEKKTVFHQSQVRVPSVSRMFTTFYAGQAGLLVNPDYFELPQDYNHLMGYDKPFSFSPDHIDPDRS
uniref:Transmembrane protein 70 n=1 Tax=Oryzias latipes TaxID=8090 RepID=A0A3P9HP96_ORYLA